MLKEVSYKDLKFNPFRLIGDEWMQVIEVAIASTQINHIKKGTLWYSYKCIILLFDTLHTNP